MLKILRRKVKPVRYTQICSYCNTGQHNKSASQNTTEGRSTKDVDVTVKTTSPKLPSSDDMKWRTPWHQKEGHYYSTLRVFYSESNNINVMKLLQSPINLTPSAIKAWWARKEEYKAIVMQQYIPERNQMLGNELAAAHFVVHRGGSVKFFGENHWIKADALNNYSLPDRFQSNIHLQAIDCTDMELYFEGLVNMRDLHQVEWFSINGCEHMDDWCMDRITNIFERSLLYLDIRDCANITYRGLGAIAKMKKLKILCVNDVKYSDEFEMTCLMLQQVLPDLDIRTE